MPKGSVLNHRDIEIVKSRAPERVPSQSAEAALIRPGPARNVDGNVEELWIVRPLSEVIVAHRPAR